MSRGTTFVVAAALLGALVGRSFLAGAGDEPDLEPLPVSRIVDDAGVDVGWERTTDLRDPFAPLVLPDVSESLLDPELEVDPEDGSDG